MPLQEIILKLKCISKLRLLSYTAEVITQFINLENKNQAEFIQLNILNYYPSINPIVLYEVCLFAKSNSDLTREEIETILAAQEVNWQGRIF